MNNGTKLWSRRLGNLHENIKQASSQRNQNSKTLYNHSVSQHQGFLYVIILAYKNKSMFSIPLYDKHV